MNGMLIVGLGNPGREYRRTPHNVGFDVVDDLAGRLHVELRRRWRYPAEIGSGEWDGREVLLVKPHTYMNNSGSVVSALMRRQGIPPERLIVALDDADLPVGQIRIRAQGSAGGHKGLQSVISHLGSDAFARIRLGIGRGRAKDELVNYVLAPFSAETWETMNAVIRLASEAVLCAMERGVETAMNRFNARPSNGPGKAGMGE